MGQIQGKPVPFFFDLGWPCKLFIKKYMHVASYKSDYVYYGYRRNEPHTPGVGHVLSFPSLGGPGLPASFGETAANPAPPFQFTYRRFLSDGQR